MQLYKIDSQILKILDSVLQNDGVIEPSQEAELDSLTIEKDQKLSAICGLIKQQHAFTKILTEEADALYKRVESIEKQISWLKDYASKSIGDSSWKCPLHSLSWRETKAVDVDETKLPEQFFTVTMSKRANKTLIKETIDSGGEVPGAEVVKRRHLQVK